MTDAANQGTGHATTYAYDGMNLIAETDPNGNTTTFAYDGQNRLTGTTDALHHSTTWAYDPAGLLATMTDANSHQTLYSHDQVGRLLTVTAPGTAPDLSGTMVAVKLTYGYNNDDQVTTVTDSLGHATSYAYDALGRVITFTDALNHQTTYGYDNAGNRTTVTDPNGHVTTSIYDARDRLLAQVAPSGGGTTVYTYDDASRPTGVTDPVGNLTSYRYDGASRLISAIDPKLAATTYTYDLADNLKTVVDRDGRTTAYAYDADNRRTAEQWFPAGGGGSNYSLSVTYDPAGRVAGVVDNNSQYAYGYDAANRLTTVNDQGTASLPQVTITYGYDSVGNRTSLADSLGGVVSYTYDARDELVTITQSGTAGVVSPERVDITYDAAGRMTALNRSSDLAGSNLVVASNYAHDAANRLTTITHQAAAGVVSSFGYTLDPAGRLTSEARTGGASPDTLTYSYTNNDQLTSVSHSNGTATETFGFDPNGNRNTSGFATAASNQTTSDGTYIYAYDAEGNLTSKTAIAGGNQVLYTWDNRNRLTEVDQVVGGTRSVVAQYTYDAMNRLIKVVEAGTTRETLYDGQTPLLDFNASGTVTARYLSVPDAVDELLARQTSSGVAWYLDDREGTVRDIVNNSGAVIDHLTYGAFGNLTGQSSPASGDRFEYAGMEADATTGLNYDRARWYDPNGGKFLAQDPSGFGGKDTNIYRYGFNNPVGFVDPTGLDGYWAGGWYNPYNYPGFALDSWYGNNYPSPPIAKGFERT